MIKSSANGCSRSRTTRGPFLIFSLWRSSSFSFIEFPWKSSTRHPGVSRRERWSRAKWRLPWKCRNTSWRLCVSTETFFWHSRQWKWLGILAASDGPVTKNLPSSVAAYTFFMRKVFLDRVLRRHYSCPSHLHWFPTFQLSVDFGMALALVCSALHSILSTGKRISCIKQANCWTRLRRKILTIH